MKKINNKPEQSSKVIKELLSAWDKETPGSVIKKQKKLSARRLFMTQSMGLMGSLAMPKALMAKNKSNLKANNKLKQPWLTLSEVQEHLFPRTESKNESSFSPGAKDINAINYLQTMLSVPDADMDEREFIIKGVGWLDGVANNMAGHSFVKLNDTKREKVLKKISESQSGANWLSTLLRYIFEALLTDPVYGGNTNKVGWQWLEHQPGFPRPPENKKYWMLRNINQVNLNE